MGHKLAQAFVIASSIAFATPVSAQSATPHTNNITNNDTITSILANSKHPCGKDLRCGLSTIEHSKTLIRHPHLFNILHATFGEKKNGRYERIDIRKGKITTQGYKNCFPSARMGLDKLIA